MNRALVAVLLVLCGCYHQVRYRLVLENNPEGAACVDSCRSGPPGAYFRCLDRCPGMKKSLQRCAATDKEPAVFCERHRESDTGATVLAGIGITAVVVFVGLLVFVAAIG